jgi:hypothetical protein
MPESHLLMPVILDGFSARNKQGSMGRRGSSTLKSIVNASRIPLGPTVTNGMVRFADHTPVMWRSNIALLGSFSP